MKVKRSGTLTNLTLGSVPDLGSFVRLSRKRQRFVSPAALEGLIERLKDSDPEERRVAEELLMRLPLNPQNGQTALVLSRCIMEGGTSATACLKKLAKMPHCPLKDALLDCVVRSLVTHREEAKEVLRSCPWRALLPYLLKEVVLRPRQEEHLKGEVVRLLCEEKEAIVSTLPIEPTELTELLIEASKEESAKEAVLEILKAWMRKGRKRASILEKLGLTKAQVTEQREAR